MTPPSKPLVLVDGSSYLYRAFHALPALMNSKGFPTGAVYGMINMLKRLIADYQPEHMAVIFDTKGKTFRDELYPAYKATRQAMPPDLARQIAPIHDLIRALGLPLIAIEGVEADDIIGTLTAQAVKDKIAVVVSTGDKDLAQLVNPHVTLINTMTNTTLNTDLVKEKFGVPPERMVDYLTLVGDTSDNIPGVPQVGPKTAAKWLNEYGPLDNLIANAQHITGKVGENLRASLKQIPLTKSLVTIQCDVDLPIHLRDLKMQPPDKKKLIDLYKQLEFRAWLAELLEETSHEQHADTHANYAILTTQPALLAWVAALKQAEIIAINIETIGLDYMSAHWVGISFALAPGKAAYVPFAHEKEILTVLAPILANPKIIKVAHDAKYVLEVLANHNVQLQGMLFDTMLESYVLDSTASNHNSDALALKYLGLRMVPFAEIAGKGNKQLAFDQIDLQKAGAYAAEKADITLQLHQLLWPRLQAERGLKHIFTEIEMPLVPVLVRMERNGVLIDPQKLQTQGKELQQRLLELEQDVFRLAGTQFNMNSPKQLQEILFEKLKLPVLHKTPKGQPSTADAVLQELALEFALPQMIIEYRSLSKLISTYTHRLIEQIHTHTKRIHTSYNQTITATGRLSSSDPNLQNIPIRTQEGRRIRQAFIAGKDRVLISADYSQIELRLMAHISEDPGLLQAFAKNLDIHSATAAEVWGVPLEEVTPAMRRDAKVINFGLIYGMSAFGLTRQLGIERAAAQNYIERYFTRYPKVKAYMDNTRTMAKEKGYVETLWGRRLYIPDIHASQIPRQKAAERAAINAPLQGSAADIIKMAMLSIDQWLREENIAATMIMQVHDELVFEAGQSDLAYIKEGIRKHMTEVVQLRVPLLVSIGAGHNWDAASAH